MLFYHFNNFDQFRYIIHLFVNIKSDQWEITVIEANRPPRSRTSKKQRIIMWTTHLTTGEYPYTLSSWII